MTYVTTYLKSERLGVEMPLGKPPAQPYNSSHIPFASVLAEVPSNLLPPVPENFGHGLVFGSTGWGMDGNGPADPSTTRIPKTYPAYKGCGDCFYAGAAHDIRESALLGGRPVPPISDLTTVLNYGRGTGYNLITGAGDNGTDPQTGLALRQSPGFKDDNGTLHTIEQTYSLTPGNLTELYYTAWLCDKAGVGVNFQQAQMDQFDAGQPWEYVEGSEIEGGHWVIVMSRDGLISWGARGGYGDSWYEKLNDESYGWTDLADYNAVTGENAENMNQADVAKYMTLVAQAKARAIGLS